MKYVIDVPDIDRYLLPSETRGSVIGIPMSVDNNKCIIATNIEYIGEYIEPDHNAIEDEVWKFSKVFYNMSDSDYDDCYGVEMPHTYQEAKAKYDAWKTNRDKESPIDLWNEVIDRAGNKGIVTDVSNDGIDVIYEDGSVESSCNKNSFRKTGRHYPQIAEILESMR